MAAAAARSVWAFAELDEQAETFGGVVPLEPERPKRGRNRERLVLAPVCDGGFDRAP